MRERKKVQRVHIRGGVEDKGKVQFLRVKSNYELEGRGKNRDREKEKKKNKKGREKRKTDRQNAGFKGKVQFMREFL